MLLMWVTWGCWFDFDLAFKLILDCVCLWVIGFVIG